LRQDKRNQTVWVWKLRNLYSRRLFENVRAESPVRRQELESPSRTKKPFPIQQAISVNNSTPAPTSGCIIRLGLACSPHPPRASPFFFPFCPARVACMEDPKAARRVRREAAGRAPGCPVFAGVPVSWRGALSRSLLARPGRGRRRPCPGRGRRSGGRGRGRWRLCGSHRGRGRCPRRPVYPVLAVAAPQGVLAPATRTLSFPSSS
jgi:hypothetical protein